MNRVQERQKKKYLPTLQMRWKLVRRLLTLPDMDSYVGLTHTLFALEDLYGFKINSIDGELCLTLDKSKGMTYVSMYDIFHAWQKESTKLKNGEITEDEYNTWRYNYPRISKRQIKAYL
jgi:hypothetical protein